MQYIAGARLFQLVSVTADFAGIVQPNFFGRL
jgi:hypothetical protein